MFTRRPDQSKARIVRIQRHQTEEADDGRKNGNTGSPDVLPNFNGGLVVPKPVLTQGFYHFFELRGRGWFYKVRVGA